MSKLQTMETRVAVAAYDPIVIDVSPGEQILGLSMSLDGTVVSLELWPEESKKLRKALKKAERVARGK